MARKITAARGLKAPLGCGFQIPCFYNFCGGALVRKRREVSEPAPIPKTRIKEKKPRAAPRSSGGELYVSQRHRKILVFLYASAINSFNVFFMLTLGQERSNDVDISLPLYLAQ